MSLASGVCISAVGIEGGSKLRGTLGKVKKKITPIELVNSYILEEYSVSIFRAMKRLIV